MLEDDDPDVNRTRNDDLADTVQYPWIFGETVTTAKI